MNNIKENIYLAALLHHEAFRDLQKKFCSDDVLAKYSNIIDKAQMLSLGLGEKSMPPALCPHNGLSSILETISAMRHDALWHINPAPISLTKNNFPNKQSVYNVNEALLRMLSKQLLEISTENLTVFGENILTLLSKYASNIPVGLEGYNDVSIYDLLKSSAALSMCLYELMESGESSDSSFLFIGADLSGIQSYLYQVASKYASKNLKGRSFYLRILSDAVVRYIRKELDLPQANVIYNSGGGFYLLAPNTEYIKNKLSAVVSSIEEKLFATHKLSLFLAIDFVELSKESLTHTGQNALGDVWGQLFLKKTQRRFPNSSMSSLNSITPFSIHS